MSTKKAKTKIDPGKLTDLKDIEGLIRKQFGEESIMLMSDGPKKIETSPTGSLLLDIQLGGGIPKGRIIEIYGPEASGKTTISLHIAAEIQKAGGLVAFIDAEHAIDPTYAQNIGVDMKNLLLSQPDSAEQALDIVEALVDTGKLRLIIIDSVAALTPQAEIDGEMGDHTMGLQARIMSKALRKLTAKAQKAGTTILFINQLRMKIGVMFGNPETTTGGNGLKYYASVRLDVRRVKSKDPSVDAAKEGIMKVKVVKNKVAVPFGEAEIPVTFGVGIDVIKEAYALAKNLCGLIETRGGTHLYKGSEVIKLSDGTELKNDENDVNNKFASKGSEAVDKLKAEPAFVKALQKEITNKMKQMVAE